jgi:hypothetical protein
MPTIIGIPAGKMIRKSVVSDTDVLGLTRLTESYAFATSEFQTFRTRLINLTPYNTVMNYVYPAPTTTYPYVVIDSVSISEEVGGISTATVQYLGILKATRASIGDTSWLPPAKQRLQPHNGAENPVSVIVDFIYYSDSLSPELDMIKKYGTGTSLPSSVNGLNLYRSIKEPYYREVAASEFRETGVDVTLGDGGRVASSRRYYGMLCVSHFSERVGLFYKVTNTYQDSAFVVDSSGGNTIGVAPSNL